MKDFKFTNHLINESSPYLLQHAHNPVNWYPWGEKALSKAQKENKLILVSIGYSACHWCHVMEKESFENETVADIMNNHYVCIKVDREERPDIDQIYMNAVQLMTGSGGWPLNCFALPDGRPVYGGTYFKSEQWQHVLESLAFNFRAEPQKFEKAAKDLKNGISQVNEIVKVNDKKDFTYEDLIEIILKLRRNFDHTNGGTWGAPKFPMPVSYFPLMRYFYHSAEKDVIKHLKLTLKKMAEGGIYDHIGGGFARYAVDKKWLVPHFEKMLYDNAQLVTLYAEAYRINPADQYRRVVKETLSFVEREMMSAEGGFYSAYDADSDGEEGKFYVWQKDEIDELLEDKAEIFCDYYDVTSEGNWESKNILNINNSKEEVAEKHKLSNEKLDDILTQSKKILFSYREKRTKPALDDKILTSWNALMLKAYVNAYNVFQEKHYLEIAEQNFSFIEGNLLNKNNSLLRNYKNGKATITAFLDDYALFAEALIEIYQATFNEEYLELAQKLVQYALTNFYDAKSGMFYYTDNTDKELIVRTREISDNVIPSSNSVMAQCLFKLGHFYLIPDYIKKAEQMLLNVKSQFINNPAYFGNWIDLMIQFIHKPHEICILGKDIDEIRTKFFERYLPNVLLAGGNEGEIPLLENRHTAGKSTIYVCQNNVCMKPAKSFTEALTLINN